MFKITRPRLVQRHVIWGWLISFHPPSINIQPSWYVTRSQSDRLSDNFDVHTVTSNWTGTLRILGHHWCIVGRVRDHLRPWTDRCSTCRPKEGKAYIDKYKRLDVAIDAFYSDKRRPQPGVASASKVNALFDRYKDNSSSLILKRRMYMTYRGSRRRQDYGRRYITPL